ncbi:MAG: GH3 auxin-responsive promoter family protein, partial [Leptolyngbyaceae bacterium]|nr:GH3 auxin-responsive promoter family protein [Leptolyngbyaceae bacterium]
PDPIVFEEKTSGSRGAAKRIPYTQGLRQSFSRMFCVWAHDLIRHGPPFSTGKVYFCVSPTLTASSSSASVASHSTPPDTLTNNSLQDDAEYLDPWLQWVLSPFLITLPQLGRIRSAEEFKQALCLRLLKETRLEILSIWSPSFLMVQLAYIQQHRHSLLQCLGQSMSHRRRDALMSDPISWVDVWPHLKLISCWDSASAADQAHQVRSLFPGVLVQGKGLLATEAPMTVPLVQAQPLNNTHPGQVPLLDEVFFEFESVDAVPTLRRLHELEEGQEYRIIVSQKGGLYRYRMGDRIRVTHLYRQTPCLEFLGRDRSISDMVGEKLNSDFVSDVLHQLPIEDAAFKSLIPVLSPQPHYVLLLEPRNSDRKKPDGEDARASLAQRLSQQLETALCQAHHYRQARLLGQLAPAHVCIATNMAERVIEQKLRRGQRWGDVKHSLLDTQPWTHNPLTVDSYCESVRVK